MGYWYAGEWHESQQIALNYDDPALIYGASVFTTLRRYGGSIDHPLTQWPAHRQRLRDSLQDLGWPEPDWQQVRLGVEHISQPVVRLAIFPSGVELIFGRELPGDLKQRQTQGVVAQLVADRARSLPQHKTGNYLAPWLAKRQAGDGEAILLDAQGQWLETSTGNLWGWDGSIWYSPAPQWGSLGGIARAQMVQWLQSQGKMVNEKPWERSMVSCLIALAYSNAVMEIIPIHTTVAADPNWGSTSYECGVWQSLRAAIYGNP
jgi:branched-subunit amino acid aminotransferase/4-amino-4-deoxychorismate lyase